MPVNAMYAAGFKKVFKFDASLVFIYLQYCILILFLEFSKRLYQAKSPKQCL